MNILQTFGMKVRRARMVKDLTQEQLSEKAQISVKHISAIERGRRFVTVKTLDRLSRGLGVEAGDLFPVSWKAFDLDTGEMAALRESRWAFMRYLADSLNDVFHVSCSSYNGFDTFLSDSPKDTM